MLSLMLSSVSRNMLLDVIYNYFHVHKKGTPGIQRGAERGRAVALGRVLVLT
jgi:hypothetical protein